MSGEREVLARAARRLTDWAAACKVAGAPAP